MTSPIWAWVKPDDIGLENERVCGTAWGTHFCFRPPSHDDGRGHWCTCCTCDRHDENEGCVAGPPYYGVNTVFY